MLPLAAAALAFPAGAQTAVRPVVITTVAGLPVSAEDGRIYVVTDALSPSDCATGGGAEIALCAYDVSAAAYVALSGASGSGDVTAVGDCATGACFSSVTARHAFLGPAGGGTAAFRALVEADISDLAHTVDTDSNCLDAGVDCLFAGSATESGPATSALDLTCTGCVAASEVAADVATQAELDAVAGAETDDQDSTEVPYTPTTAGDWIDPDPTNVGEALDDLAASGGSGSSAFADLTSGTNTTAAMVAGSGSSLKVAGTGTIDASGIDADGDGTRELTCTPGSAVCTFAPAENSIEVRIQNFGGGAPWLQLSDGSNTTGFRLYSGLSRVTYGASEVWGWGSGAIVSLASGSGFRLDLDAPSATAATFMPNQSDSDTGIGHAGGDDLRLIAGGSSGLGVTTTAVTSYREILRLTPQVNAPATCAIGDLYVDTAGELCACTSTNTWTGTTGVGSCT